LVRVKGRRFGESWVTGQVKSGEVEDRGDFGRCKMKKGVARTASLGREKIGRWMT